MAEFDRSGLDEVFEIEDAETFEMLADPTRVEILERLIQPKSVGEVAEEMGVPRTRLYHHVNLLEEAGMIQVVDGRQRGAMTEKVYRVTALSFRPSKGFLAGAEPREAAAAVVDSIFAVTRADFVRSFDDGVASFDQHGDRRTLMVTRNFMQLTNERLDSFVRELEELIERYGEIHDPDGRSVGMVAAVYPSSRRIT